MELTHDFTVPAPIESAWATFMDLEGVGQCFPGATVTEVTDDGFTGTVKVKLGPIALVYAGAGQFLSRDATAYRAVLEAKGKDKRGNGTAGATVTIQLTPSSGGTRIDVVTDLAVTGKPAQFGRGVMQDVSDKLLGQFLLCLESKFDDGGAAAPAEASRPGGAGASDEPDGAAAEPSEATATAVAPASPAASPAPGSSSAAAASTTPRPAPTHRRPSADSIDLGRTVLPVLVKEYAGRTAIAVAALVIGYLIGRRR